MALGMEIRNVIMATECQSLISTGNGNSLMEPAHQTTAMTRVSGSGLKEKVMHETYICFCRSWWALIIPFLLYFLAALCFR